MDKLILFFSAVLMMCCMTASAVGTQPSGEGTSANPYQIATKDNLLWFAEYVNQGKFTACAILTADITVNSNVLNSDGSLNSGTFETWTPIGSWGSEPNTYKGFAGEFNGNGHTISGLYFNDENRSAVGLFGMADNNGYIHDVGIKDSYFRGKSHVAGICGDLGYGRIENCWNAATVISNSNNSDGCCAGGIAASCWTDASVKGCYNIGKVTAQYDIQCGGICGVVNSTVSDCVTLDVCSAVCKDLRSNAQIINVAIKDINAFKSGEVCWILNNGVTDKSQKWYQTLGEGKDVYPMLDNTRGIVYALGKNCDGSGKGYSNTYPGEVTQDAHTIEYHPYKAPTEMEDGNIEYWHCSVCGQNFANSDCTKLITGSVIIPKIKGSWTILEQPTCSTYGTMQNPANTSELRLVPKLAHQFGDDGKCTVCGQPAPTKYNGTPAESLVTITESNYATYGLTEKNKGCVMGWTVITTAEEFMRYINSDYLIEFNAFLTEDVILDNNVNLPEQKLDKEYVLDGTGHTISNVHRSGYNYCGLYEDNMGTIRNLGLISPKIMFSGYDGGCICGFNSGVIENCFVINGSIYGNKVYGIASQDPDGKIINCYAITNVGNVGPTDIGIIANSHAATKGSNDFYANTLSKLNESKVNGMTWYIDAQHSTIPYPVIMSTMTHHPATVTCTDGGYGEYWYCTVCEKYFLDANHTQATTLEHLKLSALGHDLKHIDRVEATCVATGNIAHYHCDQCGKNFDDEVGTNEIDPVIPINPQNHPSELQHVDRVEATCSEEGIKEHYHCDRCLKNFEDENGTNEIDIVIQINPQNHPSELQHFDGAEANCTKEGCIEHYHCDQCKKDFDDENGTNEIDAVIPINSNNHSLTLVNDKAHCDRCNHDFSNFVSIDNGKPAWLIKENDEYHLKTDDGFVLQDGVNYLAPVDFIVDGDFTYRRNVSGVKAGAWQCWYEPFDVQLDVDVLTKMDVAELAGVLIDNGGNTVVAFKKIDTGKIKANTPYVFRPKDAIRGTGWLELKTTSPELRKSEETTFYNMSTYDKFTFGGNYTARHNDSWYTLNTSGVFQKMKEDVNLKGQRFWMTIEARNDIPYEYGGIADAKESIDFTVLGDDEPTGITSYENENKNESIYNLNGQRVTSIQSGQVYIMNGKKYIAR